jgi:hypothetical protein
MALLAVQMLMAMTDRAGKLVAEGQVDIPTAEEMCVQIITGGAKPLAARLGQFIDEAYNS